MVRLATSAPEGIPTMAMRAVLAATGASAAWAWREADRVGRSLVRLRAPVPGGGTRRLLARSRQACARFLAQALGTRGLAVFGRVLDVGVRGLFRFLDFRRR